MNHEVTDARGQEDGYMTIAIMWQRTVCGLNGYIVSDDETTMKKNARSIMATVEQQKMWSKAFEKESKKGQFMLR